MTASYARPEPALDQPFPGASFGAAYSRFWRKGVTFTGRASLSEFWWAYLATIVPVMVLYVLGVIAGAAARASWLGVILVMLAFLYVVACFIPLLALTWRRLHDTGQSGGLYFLCFIPVVGGIILLILLLQPSNPSGARFDVRPEGYGYAPQAGGYAPQAAGYAAPAAPGYAAPAAPRPYVEPAGPAPAPSPAPAPAPSGREAAWYALHDPATPAARLAEIASAHPEFAAQIGSHPNAYPELRAWAQSRSSS